MVSNQMSGDVYQIACVPGKKKEVLEFLRKTEFKIYGSEDFEYSILEEDVKAIYAQDRQTSIIYSVFACIAILIVGLGLFGISLFDIRQRYREIAIRKVNGASVKEILAMFVKEYFILLVAASVIAFPIGYALMKKWLESYIEQTAISVWIYLAIFSGIGLLILLCIGWRVWQAARQNPAEVIKSE